MRCFIVFALALFSLPAQAAPPKLVVLEAIGPLAANTLAGLTDRARGAAQSAWGDVLVMTRDTLEALLPPGVALADCDDECEVDAGRRVGADWVLTLRIGGVRAPHTVTATLLDTAERVVAGQGQAQGTADSLLEAVSRAVRQAVESKRARAGLARQTRQAEPLERLGPRVLRVSSTHALALFVDGQLLGDAPLTLPLGARSAIEFEVRSQGRLPARFRVEVGEGSGQIAIALPHALGVLDLRALRMGGLKTARVELDGLPLPRNADVTLRRGRYQVRLQHACASQRTVGIEIRGGDRVQLPLAALLICRQTELTSEYPDSVLMLDGRPVALPHTILVRPQGRLVQARIGGHDAQTFVVPGDAASPYMLPARVPGYSAEIKGRFRDGSGCFSAVEIDGKPAGRLPWIGQLRLGKHQIATQCRLRLKREIDVRAPVKLTMREPFGRFELSLGLAENAKSGTLSGRWWFPFFDGAPLKFGLGLQLGVTLADPTVQPAAELLFAVPGEYIDFIMAPFASDDMRGLRVFGRARIGRVPIDVGYGINLVGNSDTPTLRSGLFLGSGVVF